MNLRLDKKSIALLLEKELPGESAHLKMQPPGRPGRIENGKCRDAAVLIVAYQDGHDTRIVLMKRNEYNGPHSGQISLPGGIKENSDPDLSFTAIRETEEEIGVSSAKIELLGALSPLEITVSNFCVYPFVGWMEGKPEFQPDQNEVQYLICPTIKELCDPGAIKETEIKMDSYNFKVPCLAINGEIIWGATAMIISEFIELINC